MSNRLMEMFENVRGRRGVLIAYATGGFPDMASSREVILAMLDAGADAVEIGIPFSDPVMDGPVIQSASCDALSRGATPAGMLELAAGVREQAKKPVLLMTYFNPVFRYGLENFAADAVLCGVDGVVIPDLPAEEMGPWKAASDAARLATVPFCSVTTSLERIDLISTMATGFIYCVSLLGTTGVRKSVSPELGPFLERVRERTDAPLAVGLGISTPEQCAEVGRYADGVIVGSALVREVAGSGGDLAGLREMVRGMSGALIGICSSM
jgi:tryptophan synthase alpha chain